MLLLLYYFIVILLIKYKFLCLHAFLFSYFSFNFISIILLLRTSYERNFPMMCKTTTLPTKERLAMRTVVGPICNPGLSSV